MISVVQIFKMEEMFPVLIYNIAEEVEELSFTYMKYKWLPCVHGKIIEILNVNDSIFCSVWLNTVYINFIFLNCGVSSLCFI